MAVYAPPLWAPAALRWALATAALLVGVVCLGAFFDGTGRVPAPWRPRFGLIGVAGTLGGAVGGMVGVLQVLTRTRPALVVTLDGLWVRGVRGDHFHPWVGMGAIGWEPGRGLRPGRLRIASGDGPAAVAAGRYAGAGGPALAAELERFRRDALLGALRPAPAGRRRAGSRPIG